MIPTVPQEPGKKKALALTALVHLALLGALLYGVHWKNSQPAAVEVELWSPPPAPAPAPLPEPPEVKPEPPPEPKPEPKPEPAPEIKPPAKPDIALKAEKKPPKPEPKPEPKPQAKPEAKPEPRKAEPRPDPFKEMLEREDRQRSAAQAAETQARLAAQAETDSRAAATAAASRRGQADYANKIRVKVRGNIMLPTSLQGNPEAVFEVNQLPSGEVLAVKLKKSSGNAALDGAIERAILKSSPLPKPDDPSLFQRTLEIKYKPFEE